MLFEDAHAADVAKIKHWCRENETFSWPSPKYQNDILDFAFDHRFGPSPPIQLIGQAMNGSGHATIDHPQPDGRW